MLSLLRFVSVVAGFGGGFGSLGTDGPKWGWFVELDGAGVLRVGFHGLLSFPMILWRKSTAIALAVRITFKRLGLWSLESAIRFIVQEVSSNYSLGALDFDPNSTDGHLRPRHL